MNVIWRPATPGHRAVPIHVVRIHLKIAAPWMTTVEGSGRLTLSQTPAHFDEIFYLELTVIRRDLAWMSKGKFIRRNFLPEDPR